MRELFKRYLRQVEKCIVPADKWTGDTGITAMLKKREAMPLPSLRDSNLYKPSNHKA